ncbi:MAG TPA: IPT/TIG domain-containing protein [Candidatus Acidoferrales bacterium]|nr:IPT/TIG domain-containing protein [Candidatus Acidoferrales bacterium]
MLNSTNLEKIGEHRFPKRTLYGTLALLALAAHCAAAPGTVAVTNVTTAGTGGFIYDGARLWVSDATLGLCRMDPGGAGFKLSNCILPSTSLVGTKAVLGQPAFDAATGLVYLPDQSTTSKGIWRYHFNGQTFDTSTAFNVAPASGLGAQRPTAVALGPDGNLYAIMNATTSFFRVNTPAGAAQTVDNLGVSPSKTPVRSLTFAGATLWLGDTTGEYIIPGVTACTNSCKGILNAQVGIINPLSLAFDATNSLVYIGTSSGVFQNDLLTGQTVLYSKTFVNGAATGLLTNVSAVGVDAVGNLFYTNDPTVGQTVGGATVYTVPVNSVPDGQGNVASPISTIPPTVNTLPAFANPALFVSSGLTAPLGAVFMGTHVWVVDSAQGFCKVDPTLPSPSLTGCAVLPVGFVPGAPAYDKASNQVYLGDTTAGGAGIVKLTFSAVTPATEKVGAATTVVTNTALTAGAAGATAPTALAVGPDGSLYAAMAGAPQIVRVTTPAAATHKVVAIGAAAAAGSLSIAFHNSDLWVVDATSAKTMFGATLCQGNCTSLFFAANMNPTAVASDSNFVYFGGGGQVMAFDPVANTLAIMADTGLVNGVPTPFAGIAAITTDGLGHVFAADGSRLWSIIGSGVLPSVTSISPVQAPEGSTQTMTITGNNFVPGSLVVSTCAAITPGNVTVVSLTQITATFAINPIGPIGPCAVTVATANGASAASGASSFLVLIGPPALTSITPASGFRGRTVPVSIAGANMALGTINPIPGITITNTVATANLTTANFVIGPLVALGPQNVTMTTPSGTSNILTFTINAATAVLTSITPAQGVASTTVPVTLTGTDLFQATLNPPAGFTLSGTPVVTTTSITATFVISSTVTSGPQSITVTTPGGTSNAVTFNISPVLTSLAPITAKAGTATAITLTGTSLTALTTINAGANITVSNVVAAVNQITATFTTLNSSPLGAQSITVTTPGGTSNAETFTITQPTPVLTSIAPATGFRGATVPVTLAGSGLVGATFNLPAGITLSGTPVVTFSQITANFVIDPAAPLGAQSITVTTPGTGGISNAVTFTVSAPLPTLTSIAPAVGVANTTVAVTLTGTGLVGATFNLPAGFTVSGTPAITFTSITASLAIASTVPAGPQSITVTTPGGTSNAVTYTILPNLVSIAPSQARAGTATVVTLTGTSLAAVTSVNAGANITVSGIAATAGTVTATFTSVPAAPVGPVSVTVTDANGTSNAVTFTLTGPIPVISSISPVTGARGSTVALTLTGTGLTLGTLNLPAGITISGTPVVSFTQITASLVIDPAAPLGAQTITVTTPGTGNTSNAVTFTVFAPLPTLTSIAPAVGVANTTVAVTLTGTGLVGATFNLPTGFTVSGTPVITFTSITASLAIASTVPAGPQSITVTTPGGTSNAVTFKILPNLVSIAPTQARAGASTAVTLTGTSLAAVTSVSAGANITVTNVVLSANQITATFTSVPAAPVGPVSVTVTDANGTSNALTFTLTGPIPVINSLSPATGGTGVTVPITITGTGLTLGTLNLPAGITVTGTPVVSFTQITASLLIAGNAPLGAQSISVTTPGTGNTSNAVTFTVFALAPLINTTGGIAPATAAANTTVAVTLTGQGFTGVTSVNVGAGITVQSFTIVSGSQINATFVIALTAATQQISVTNPNGTSNPVTFGIVPTLTTIAPATQPANTSATVTLTGTSLTGATSINAGANITVTNLTVVSSTQITATFAIATAAVQGNRNITVTTPGGTTGAVVFNVLPPPPTITSMNSPYTRSTGVTNQGVTVGGGFVGTSVTTQVFLNGTSIPLTISATPVAGKIIIQSGSTNFTATQLRWNWTIPSSFPATSGTNVYTLTVTTPSGISAPFVFTVN